MQIDATTAETSARHAQWAFFRCGERGFAIPIDRVAEIVPPAPATRLPGTGAFVYGLVGLRGRVITVFDLGVIAGGRPVRPQDDHRLVFVRRGGRLFGFAVDTMVTITTTFEPATAIIDHGGLEAGDVRAALLLEGQSYLQLDVDHLLGRLLA